jgi:Mg2+ and Co2+ transporter CorA
MKALEEDVERLRIRTDGTIQVLMSTMSIVESQRAIAQAEVVSKLTQLAFFFIPLTFIGTLFGMNIKVSPLICSVFWLSLTIQGI